jgi:hypothetical protein
MFYSEEKNQKPFTSCSSGNIQAIIGMMEPAEKQEFLLLFFKKEDAFRWSYFVFQVHRF